MYLVRGAPWHTGSSPFCFWAARSPVGGIDSRGPRRRWPSACFWASSFPPFRLSAFPDNANHQHLSLLLLILVLLADSRGSDDERNALAALQSMRWIAVIGVFWAGVMKLFCGYWLGGEFLAFRVAGNSGFTQVLGLLVSREEGSSCWVSEWILGPGPFAPMLRF